MRPATRLQSTQAVTFVWAQGVQVMRASLPLATRSTILRYQVARHECRRVADADLSSMHAAAIVESMGAFRKASNSSLAPPSRLAPESRLHLHLQTQDGLPASRTQHIRTQKCPSDDPQPGLSPARVTCTPPCRGLSRP